jgi:hypothetical protein
MAALPDLIIEGIRRDTVAYWFLNCNRGASIRDHSSPISGGAGNRIGKMRDRF